MDFVKVAQCADLPAGKMMMVTANGKEILLANVAGAYSAIANQCTHLGGSLAKGELDGCIVKCPRHGAAFDVTTGKTVGEAKIAFIKMKVKDETAYTVKVEGPDILVGIP